MRVLVRILLLHQRLADSNAPLRTPVIRVLLHNGSHLAPNRTLQLRIGKEAEQEQLRHDLNLDLLNAKNRLAVVHILIQRLHHLHQLPQRRSVGNDAARNQCVDDIHGEHNGIVHSTERQHATNRRNDLNFVLLNEEMLRILCIRNRGVSNDHIVQHAQSQSLFITFSLYLYSHLNAFQLTAFVTNRRTVAAQANQLAQHAINDRIRLVHNIEQLANHRVGTFQRE